ncbi:MAG: flagellar biosynthetic protein FliO [Rhabdochlamydiaceae bacterium]|nr:flagellar biosynthetic protein FliO [Rhabdochlamydiaceae bacterium]
MFIKVFSLFLMIFSLHAAPMQPPAPPLATETPIETVVIEPQIQHPETPPPVKDHESYEHAFIKMILTLGGLLVLVFLTLWLLRKFSQGRIGGFGSTKKIKILEKKPLSPKTVLYLVELDGKQVFIAESQLEIKTLLSPQMELDE